MTSEMFRFVIGALLSLLGGILFVSGAMFLLAARIYWGSVYHFMGFIIGVRLSTFGGVITDLGNDRFFCEFLVLSFF